MEICMQQVNNSGAVWDKGTGIDRIRIRQREKFNLYNNWGFRKSYRDDSRMFLFGKRVRVLSLNTHNNHTLHANCPWRRVRFGESVIFNHVQCNILLVFDNSADFCQEDTNSLFVPDNLFKAVSIMKILGRQRKYLSREQTVGKFTVQYNKNNASS